MCLRGVEASAFALFGLSVLRVCEFHITFPVERHVDTVLVGIVGKEIDGPNKKREVIVEVYWESSGKSAAQ